MNGRSRKKSNKTKLVAVSAFLLFLALSLVGLLGGLGNAIKRFLTGAFGFASYAVVVVAAALAIIKGFGFVKRKGKGRVVAFIAALTVLLLLYAQIVTSYKLYYALDPVSYKGYLSACYGAGLKTSGGVIGGILSFPLLSLMGKYSAIVVSALFFIVLFFALLPFMRSTAREDAPSEKRAPKKKGGKTQKEETELRLFVDKVRAGEKDAAVLKQRRFFDKKVANFEVYNVNDDRPFAASAGGTIPASNPDRYNPYADFDRSDRSYGRATDRAVDFDFDDEEGGWEQSADRYPRSSSREDSFRAESRGELPLFMRRYAEDKVSESESVSGKEERTSSRLPEEPEYPSSRVSAYDEKKPDAPKKNSFGSPLVSDVKKRKPAHNSADIISDVSDLDRLNGKTSSAPRREAFIGEQPTSAPEKEIPTKESPRPIADPTPSDSAPDRLRFVFPKEPKFEYKQDAMRFDKPKEETPRFTEPQRPAEPVRPVEPIEPIVPIISAEPEKTAEPELSRSSEPKPVEKIEEKPIETIVKRPIEEPAPISKSAEAKTEPAVEEKKPEPFARPTMTADESSYRKPVEQEYHAAPAPTEVKRENQKAYSRPTFAAPAPQPESEEETARKRKPRSDIGGTHYTEAKRQESAVNPAPAVPSYIPPKKAEQTTIESAEEELPPRPYTPPPVSMLTEYPPLTDEEGVEEMGERLVQALAAFNISSEIVDHKTGPTFTQYAVTLPASISVNKITPLDKDIKRKLMLEKKDIRIIPSVPGYDAVGIEVPNKTTATIGLRSLINSPEFLKENKLFFAIGVDVSGKPVYGDLLKMPHLLVAGSTGSGKSVCLNVMICSIMYHYSPEIVRFIMIDPKRVELAVYNNMPHMIMPNTVTDVNKAINALNWAVAEMYRRYDMFQESSCRNIFEYNDKQKKTGGKRMYYIVIIIDEMAELMTRAKKDVEDKIQSLMALARAAGIHLVIATQRPSVDVITGTIKNNIPTRIAFKVTSVNDSRTILDRGGAEALFGHGDMLYCPSDGGEPIRLQGPFLDSEVLNIVEFIKEHNDCRFDANAEKVIQAEKAADQDASALNVSSDPGSGDDPLFADALLSVIDLGQASISKLQRVFRIGYSRAARIVDQMEEKGYIGPTDASNKPRAVLITREEYYELYGDDGIQGGEAQ
ncbi:MAG: hypothetical protein K5753_00755 [Clostridia bacterium]|nr:hypothetical protein [Clostridia bacterium]